MTLRTRFTILYSLLAGGILLLFGAAVYFLVSFMLTNQLDDTLTNTSQEIVANTRIDSVGELDVIILPRINFTSNILIQVWDASGKLHSTSENISGFSQPLDVDNSLTSEPIFRNSVFQGASLRTMSLPLLVGNRQIGTLQVATSMDPVNTTREILFYILIGTTFFSMFLAGISSWFVIGHALAPIKVITEAAMQISHANDLTRRIPFHGTDKDEIGKLITSFNETLERLDKLFASQQRFLADVSHELRTPLTVIKANTDLMRRSNCTDLESLESINEETDRLTRMVGDLLLLAQAESGKLPLVFEPVDLDGLLLDVVREMHSIAGDRVKLKVTEIDQVQISGDRDRLKQVMVNLISNAIKYIQGEGNVTIKLTKANQACVLEIRDSGPGIPAEDLPHIFERFYRAEKSRSRMKPSGFGLGLSIVYWIVTNHAGTIEVDSQVGSGTTFTIMFPLVSSV